MCLSKLQHASVPNVSARQIACQRSLLLGTKLLRQMVWGRKRRKKKGDREKIDASLWAWGHCKELNSHICSRLLQRIKVCMREVRFRRVPIQSAFPMPVAEIWQRQVGRGPAWWILVGCEMGGRDLLWDLSAAAVTAIFHPDPHGPFKKTHTFPGVHGENGEGETEKRCCALARGWQPSTQSEMPPLNRSSRRLHP